MPNPNDTFSATWKGSPPGMPAGDYEVWRIFRDFGATRWDAFAFDVELWNGAAPLIDGPPEIQKMWARNTARRIDCVGWRDNLCSILEVRTAAAWQTFGQIQGYAALWPLNYPTLPVEQLWIVTDQMADDIRQVAVGAGFYVWTPDRLDTPTRPKIVWPEGAHYDMPHQ